MREGGGRKEGSSSPDCQDSMGSRADSHQRQDRLLSLPLPEGSRSISGHLLGPEAQCYLVGDYILLWPGHRFLWDSGKCLLGAGGEPLGAKGAKFTG